MQFVLRGGPKDGTIYKVEKALNDAKEIYWFNPVTRRNEVYKLTEPGIMTHQGDMPARLRLT